MESTAACWVDEVPGLTGAVLGPSSGIFESSTAVPGPGSAVPGLASTVAAPDSSAEILVPPAGALESDSTSSV